MNGFKRGLEVHFSTLIARRLVIPLCHKAKAKTLVKDEKSCHLKTPQSVSQKPKASVASAGIEVRIVANSIWVFGCIIDASS